MPMSLQDLLQQHWLPWFFRPYHCKLRIQIGTVASLWPLLAGGWCFFWSPQPWCQVQLAEELVKDEAYEKQSNGYKSTPHLDGT